MPEHLFKGCSSPAVMSIYTVQLNYKVTSTRESLTIYSHASHEYMQGYLPVEGLQGLKLVQDFNVPTA